MFDDLLTAAVVSIDGDRCLNTRHDRAGCRRCIDACPTAAIDLVDGLPFVDETACVRCGACVPVCPTDAATAGDASERRLMETCVSVDARTVTISCVLNPNPRTDLDGGPSVRHGRCLAALSVDQLLGLTRDGKQAVRLDMSWCAACPIGSAGDSVIAAVEALDALIPATRRLVSLVGLPGVVDEPTASDEAVVVDSRRPSMSRRGLFSSMRRRAESAVQRGRDIAPPPLRRTRGPVLARLPQGVPASRLRLLAQLRQIDRLDQWPEAPAARLPFADVRISSGCSACGLCARYCPTGALSFTTTPLAAGAPSTFSLSFQVGTCIDCGICAVACPEDAVTFGATLDTRALDEPNSVEVRSGTLATCSSCKLPTATADGPEPARCFSCRLGSGVVTALRDDAGLMADLLSRLPRTDE